MGIKNEGICRFCLKTFSGSAMDRHLLTCEAKKQKDNEDITRAGKKKPQTIYHLKIYGYKPYWLHLETNATTTLADLDGFLRGIWLECCGHLSEFTIDGIRYSGDVEDDWGMESESMDVYLKKVLAVKDKFKYEYDFGSTTQLAGEVFAERQGILNDEIRILARNNLPEFECISCENQATKICTDCQEFYCEKCASGHECGEEMTLPIPNSPRMGVCAYDGQDDFDDFKM